MKLGFVGAGVMSGAIARGVRASGDVDTRIFLYDPDTEKSRELANETSAYVCQSVPELVRSVDVLILGVKPGIQPAVLREIAPALTAEAPVTLVSIAAGRSLEAIVGDLAGADHIPAVVRVMPNVAAQVGEAMSALTATAGTDRATINTVSEIFSAVGRVMELPESLFSVFTAMAGSSPAWMFYIVNALAQAGVAGGLTKQQALEAATQAMLGSARLLQLGANSGVHPGQLIDEVCSPGGTTVAGLLAAEEAGLASALHKAVAATVARDVELREE